MTPTEPVPTYPGRRARSWRALASLVLVALLSVPLLPAVGGGAAHAAAPLAQAARAAPPAVPTAPGAAGLPGQSPANAPYADGAAYALRAWEASAEAARRANASATAPAAPAGSLTAPLLGGNGTVTGKVYDYTRGRPVVNATVLVSPTGLTVCGAATCSVGQTDAMGRFSLDAPVGTIIVSYTADYYISNRSWTTIADGATTDLGVLYLIHDGYATGIVEDNMPSPLPISGAELSASSRDGTTTTNPPTVSAANGSFTLAVPPLPSIIQVTSPGNPTRYLENTTYANLTPYETIDLGVIHLEGGVPVTATFVDRVTGLPISNQSPAQLTLCTRRAGYCLPPIIDQNGSRPTGYALPGAASIRAYAIGYILNETPVADIPNTHAVVDLGTVYLTPLSLVEISTNVTGGDPPSAPWDPGNVTVIACSLDDEEVTFQINTGSELLASPCTPRGVAFSFVPGNSYAVGATALIVAPPLRDSLFLEAASVFPYAVNELASATPLWPAAYDNVTWVNTTPGRVTLAGSFDLTPGAMLSGNISVPAGLGLGPVSVKVCSTDVSTLCDSGSRGGSGAPAGCPTNPTSFCVASPPGPVVVTVSSALTASNQTWVEVGRGCCAQDGRPVDIGWLNLSGGLGWGSVNGTIVAQTGAPGGPTTRLPAVLLTVQACPVGPPPVGLPSPGCTDGLVDNVTDAFNFTAPLGWDRVLVTASGYQTNATWIDVTGNNTTGEIQLAPDAVLVGRVLDARGGPVYSATANACLAALVTECMGSFVTNTFGEFNGSLRGGPLPWGTYEITVTASGYAPSWIWTNTTPGAVTFLPPVVLYPVGSGAATVPPGAPPPASNASVGAWVSGRLVDTRTSYGVPDALVNECPLLGGGGCLNSVASTTAGGTFNVSVVLGAYYLTFSVINYAPARVYLNATGVTHLELGAIPITPDPWISGRVLIYPWASLTGTLGLGAPLAVEGCSANLSRCDLMGPTATDGAFNVSVPAGPASALLLVGRGIQGFGSAGRGFDSDTVTVDATSDYVALPRSGPTAPTVSIYGAVVGRVVDGSTWDSLLGRAREACGFCTATVTVTNSSQASYLDVQLGGGGNYTAFVPDDGAATVISGAASAFWPNAVTVAGAVAPAGLAAAPASAPIHYGWVTLRLLGTGGAPVPYAFVTSAAPDPANGTAWYAQSLARGDGFVNVTAGIGASVAISIAVPGYYTKNLTVAVAPSRTDVLGNVTLTGGAPPTVLWINTTAQNVVGVPPTPTVVDAVTAAPLPNVYVTAVGPTGGGTGSVITNGLGQFLFWGGLSPSTIVQLALPGYDSLDLYYNTTGVYQLTVNRSLMVGDGVVAGQVLAMPGGRPVYDALVQLCPYGNACSDYTYTNATGVFWVMGGRGFDTVTVVDDSYLTNVTVSLNVASDSWQWIGTLPVYSFAGIVGTVRAIPSGLPIPGANVSVCSPFGFPTGPCNFWVPTDANGSFYTPAPPGNYILSVSAPGYNTSFLPLTLLPGVNLSIGNLFLFADGALLGTVVSGLSGTPIPGATLIACATYRTGYCSNYTTTTSAGAFLLVAPPGPVRLTASAANYFDNYSTVYVPSGETLLLPPIALAPVAADVPESLAGTVTDARDGSPIAGAFVAALQGATTVTSTATNAAGAFRLALTWGTYTIVAGAPGYAPSRATLVVHANLTGALFALALRTYPVSGVVTDASDGAPIGGVSVAAGGTNATSAANGSYALALPNGTYEVTVTPPSAAGGLSYAPLTFSVVVSAGPVSRSIQLQVVAGTVVGEVVDALSGLAVVGASVAAYLGTEATAVATASATGSFSLALPPGTYTLTASAAGYKPASASVTVPTSGGPVVLSLQPLGATPAGGVAVSPLLLGGAAVAVVVVVAVAVVLYRRRPPPPPPPPKWTLEDLEEPDVT